MPKYYVAVKNSDPYDCRAFLDIENALEVVTRHKNMHLEERCGRLIKYFDHESLKMTVLCGEDIKDIFAYNKNLIGELARRIYDFEDADVEISSLELEYSSNFQSSIGIWGGIFVRNDDDIPFKIRFIFIDVTEEELDNLPDVFYA